MTLLLQARRHLVLHMHSDATRDTLHRNLANGFMFVKTPIGC
jgi:hypothetical protein